MLLNNQTQDFLESLASFSLHPRDVRILRNGQYVPQHLYTCTEYLLGISIEYVDHNKLLQYYRDGWSLVIQFWNRFDEKVQKNCKILDRVFTKQIISVFCNVYVTPPRSLALPLHFDTHNVLVHQLSGSKYWKIYHDRIEVSSRYDRLNHQPGLIDPSSEATETILRVGNKKHIPAGRPHVAWTEKEHSLHISYGTHFLIWTDIMARRCRSAFQRSILQQSNPNSLVTAKNIFLNSFEEFEFDFSPLKEDEIYSKSIGRQQIVNHLTFITNNWCQFLRHLDAMLLAFHKKSGFISVNPQQNTSTYATDFTTLIST